jgi:hypothetical protein
MGGVLSYALEIKDGQPRGKIIGGNMAGNNIDSLKKEFNAVRKVRPDIKKNVWHNSLRLIEGESISEEKFNLIAEKYMDMMGFSQSHQRVIVMHNDPEGQHVHIIAQRIGANGSVYLGKNENLRSTKIISELEKEFGLVLTKGVDYDHNGKIVMPERSNIRKEEIEKALRIDQEPVRLQLQKIIDHALKEKPNFSAFVERLENSGVTVRPTVAKGAVTGLSFELDGVAFSGSKLGSKYKYTNLTKGGLSYDENRHGPVVKRLRSEAEASREHGRAPGADKADDAAHGKSDRANGRGNQQGAISNPGAGTFASNELADDDRKPSEADRRSAESERGDEDFDSNSGSADEETGLGHGDNSERDQGSNSEDPGYIESTAATATTDEPASPSVVSGSSDSDKSVGAASIGNSGDIADIGIAVTVVKWIDDLSRAAKKVRDKMDREAIARAKQFAEIPPPPVSKQNSFLAQLSALIHNIAYISGHSHREALAAERQRQSDAAEKASQEAAKKAETDAAFERNNKLRQQEIKDLEKAEKDEKEHKEQERLERLERRGNNSDNDGPELGR